MLGNLAWGALFICIFGLILCLGMLICWTIFELPSRIRENREFRQWKRYHTKVFF